VEVLTTGHPDVVFVDGITLTYQRYLDASSGALAFDASGECTAVKVSTADVMLLDTTRSNRPVKLTGFDLLPDGSGYLLRFQERPRRSVRMRVQTTKRSYLVVDPQSAAAPVFLGEPSGRDLSSPQLAADYLVITHPDFLAPAQRMVDHHQARGLEALVVTTDEIYDAFSHGRPGAQAIRDLIELAHRQWQKGPAHVLLVGGADVDMHGNFVPAPFRVTDIYGYEAAADGWYVEGSDGLPRAAIGRLAVRDAVEADQVVDKILAFHETPPQNTGRMLVVADRGSPGSIATMLQFEKQAERLIESCLPPATQAQRLFLADDTDPAATLNQALQQGVDAVHFLGHAYLEGWSSPAVLTTAGADALANQPFLAFSWSCFDGAFTGPWGDALSWALVRNPSGGAVCAVASSSLTAPEPIELFSQQVLCRLTSGQAATIGQAVQEAKRALAPLPVMRDTLATFNFLGDPATPNPWLR
jgi:hypothetical protein